MSAAKQARQRRQYRRRRERNALRRIITHLPEHNQQEAIDAVQSLKSGSKDTFFIPKVLLASDDIDGLGLPDKQGRALEDMRRFNNAVESVSDCGGFYKTRGGCVGQYMIWAVRAKQHPARRVCYCLAMYLAADNGVLCLNPDPIVEATCAPNFPGHENYIEAVKVDALYRSRGLAEMAVAIMGWGLQAPWWCAGTDDGRAFSAAMVRKGLARSIGYDTPRGRMDDECFEYIRTPEYAPSDDPGAESASWSYPIPAEQFLEQLRAAA